ncbi:hypothetical protein NC652_005906 [Populus alba x Populus x berolinensis]|nr:hypothetical protein NC652_005906 [Populus alba x Populus x berolinensis]
MSKFPSSKPEEYASSSTSETKESNGTLQMDGPEDTIAAVARFIEKLHSRITSPPEKELVTACLLRLAKARKETRTVIGSHAQAMPLFISILRSGTSEANLNQLRLGRLQQKLYMKFPLARSLMINSVSRFATEGVTTTLWEQLNPKNKQDKVVQGFVTGALRNLCRDKDNYWRATLEAGGVDIIVDLLSSDNAAAQSNAASLLARLMLAFGDSIPKVIDSGAVQALLQLVDQNNDISVRASAADALEALSLNSTKAKKAIVDAGGVPILIGAMVAPSKECMQGEFEPPLLAAPFADITGSLTDALMVFEQNAGADEESFDATKIEDILVKLLEPH